ncbi:VPLPA-CTERM sorting domain-containing protein [Primorskyibacter sp. S187A]|uniref:VPLPA-CTERM sorting domain-containing protein n=1 Tax=Primorskyibacter sp. S187A TaxID=3415130 RepID=UPI003C7A203C
MTFRIFVAAAVAAVSMGAAASAATLVNGSLTGPISNGGVPVGWTTLGGSPDTMDENNNVGAGTPFGVAPVGPSDDGGTWVGIASGTGAFQEIFGQTINDFVIGQSYDLTFFAGNFGAETGPGYLADNAVTASLDGTMVGMSDVLSLDENWYAQSITFMATSTSHVLSFGLTDAANSYLSIDGIALTPKDVTAPVPLPAGGMLLLTALGGIAIARRRKA